MPKYQEEVVLAPVELMRLRHTSALCYRIQCNSFEVGTRLMAQQFGSKRDHGEPQYVVVVVNGDVDETVLVAAQPASHHLSIILPEMPPISHRRNIKFGEPRHQR